MDLKLKSITWVGKNISQKFETMCQEVDNIVSQDTVKYVENQMLTMGDNVKKFCSDVVQDFLPPLVDPVKHGAEEVVLKSNVAIGTYLKSMMGLEENSADIINKHSPTEPNTFPPEMQQLGNEFSGLHIENQLITPISANLPVEAETDLVSGKIDDDLKREISDVNNEENATKEKSSISEVLQSMSLDEEESSEASPFCEFADCNHKNACDFVSEVSSVIPVHVVEGQSSQKMDIVCDDFVDNSLSDFDASNTSAAAAEMVFSARSCEGKSEVGFVSSINSDLMESNSLHDNSPENFPTKPFCDLFDGFWCVSDSSDVISSTLSPLAYRDDEAAEVGLIDSCSVMSMESNEEDVTRTNCTMLLSDISLNSTAEFCGSPRFDAVMTSMDNGPSHYHNELDYSGMETVELCDKAKLEDSCVMVDSSALYAVSHRTQKCGSFKKRIQDAFASKKRLAKEYEQLAIWFGDSYMGPSQEKTQSLLPPATSSTLDSKNLSKNQISDTEWELL